MENGVERKRRTLIQENAGFAPRNSFRNIWYTKFSWIGSQTDGWNLIDGFNKAVKISSELSLDSV